MKKILVLIIAILSIYILYKKYYFSTISKINNFKIQNKNRVVISFSTIPTRAYHLNKVIKRLQNQIVKPDMIYINIPYYSKRMKMEYPYIYLNNYPNVKIIRCPDYGPATKLLGCIPYENNPETNIITIDDDRIYNPDMIQKLVVYSENYPNCAIGYQALDSNLNSTVCHPTRDITDPYVHYLEGFGGILYKRKFITDEMLNYFENLSPECFLSDDLTISSWLHKNGICRIRICETSQELDENIDFLNPLYKESRKYVYEKCHNQMNYI